MAEFRIARWKAHRLPDCINMAILIYNNIFILWDYLKK